MTSVSDIRSSFLSFFAERDHEVVASSPLVPQNDPTLMFANSGMVQFKNVFTGAERRTFSRATTSQKCVRAGGKHNDLENVGYTARHHTFFEMLGNFSFGDYFKEVAIEQAWSLVTGEFGLNKDKMLVTVYSKMMKQQLCGVGSPAFLMTGLFAFQHQIISGRWVQPDLVDHAQRFFMITANIFWWSPGSADEDGDRFIEIWNLVFMQYEQTETDRISLPRPSIDTGMGLERIAAVLQGKHDNYDIDLMRALIHASADISNTDPDGFHNNSHRVVADHLRSAGFLIADGVLPSNEGRGYVLRRIMRRAMRHLHQLGCSDPVMYRLVPALVREMGAHYPELIRAESLVAETLRLEETRFKEALERGLKLLTTDVEGGGSGGVLGGDKAFRLYDTFGFPLDLTEDFLRGYGWKVDVAGFDAAMSAQKEAARAAWVGSGEKADQKIFLELADKNGPTEFLGYTSLTSEAVVSDVLKEGSTIDSAKTGDEVIFCVNQTPFYAESGGQVGDTGAVRWADGSAVIVNTTKTAGLFLHHARIDTGTLAPGQGVSLDVDVNRREALKAHHSATHLLHEALRQVLGNHVAQKGSLVTNSRLRFDFSHPKPMSAEDIAAVEAIVNARIRMNSKVVTKIMTPDEAIKEGALALFGEKYSDEVRVVSMGGASDQASRLAWSVELCGGTHVDQTGDIALLHVISESAVAGGVRRIEAATHAAGLAGLVADKAILSELSVELKTPRVQLTRV